MHERVGEILAARHPAALAERIRAVPNGFDADDFRRETKPPPSLPLRLCYTGVLYGGQRDLGGLLLALRRLVNAQEVGAGEIEFIYAGPDGGIARRMAAECGASEFLKDLGSVSAEEARRLQESSHLLVIAEKAEHHPLILANLPGKAVEYLGARRAILALVHPKSSVADLIRETGSGAAMLPRDMESIQRYVKDCVANLRAGIWPEMYGDQPTIERWSWSSLSIKLAGVLAEAAHGAVSGSSVGDVQS
jgi:glycosyltransferase involved in cell wall biosynthesis